MIHSPWPINTISLSQGLFSIKNRQKTISPIEDEENEEDFRLIPQKKQTLNLLELEKFNNSSSTIFCDYVPQELFKFEGENSIHYIQKHIKSYGSMISEDELNFCLQLLFYILYHEEILQQYIDKDNGEEEDTHELFNELNKSGELSSETKSLLLDILKKNDRQNESDLFEIKAPWKNNILGAFQVTSLGVFSGCSQIKFLPTGELICKNVGFEVFGKIIVEEYNRFFPIKKIQQCTSFYDLFIF